MGSLLSAAAEVDYRKVLMDTQSGLEKMRNSSSGLVGDRITFSEEGLKLDNLVASTNVALDLLVQMESPGGKSIENIDKVINSLWVMPKFKKKGSELFYWGYRPSAHGGFRVDNGEVSSIDNLHLALALWTVGRNNRVSQLTRDKAKVLFSKMKLTPLLQSRTGLIHGAYSRRRKWFLLGLRGRPQRGFTYSNWGAEARSVYSLGIALGLIDADPATYAAKLARSLTFECTSTSAGKILSSWDGGLFQYFLPELLFEESRFSRTTRNSLMRIPQLMRTEKSKRRLTFAPAFSACQTSVPGDAVFPGAVGGYSGVVGFQSLMSPSNPGDVRAEHVVSPHALMLAATQDPLGLARDVSVLAQLRGSNGPLYRPGFGFLDGFHIDGPYKRAVVPVQLSLDQGMIALSAQSLLAQDGRSSAARALANDAEVQRRLRSFYEEIEPHLAQTCRNASELGID